MRLWRCILLGVLSLACSRKANIADEPDAGTDLGPNLPDAEGGLPPLEDAGLDHPELLACEARPENGGCRGANDFPCDFLAWVPALAEECQQATGCVSNGSIAVELGADGCARTLFMSDPNPEFVDCMVEILGQYRCPCASVRGEYFLGLGNDGCPDGAKACRSGEFPCDAGEVCLNGICVPAESGAGGAYP